ncbi:hypothetical protein TNCV_3587441 [Trichonephila clavipes]|nr:hypothetical protein TNCV_3587441 [Trichonephila clavipes]
MTATGIPRSINCVAYMHMGYRKTKDCWKRPSKSRVLAMSTKATTIRAMRCSTLATCISYTSDFRRPQMENYKGLRFGERGSQVTVPPPLIPSRIM